MKACLPATLCLILCASFANGGTIRHDRQDSDYLNLGASYSSVGKFTGTTASSSFLASGTLIAPDWILTAAHVVDRVKTLNFSIGGSTYAASKWVAHEKWNGNLGAGYDIALVQLGAPITGITPAARYTGSNELGALGTSVGFGRTGTGLTGSTTLDGKKRGGQNMIDAFYPGSNNRIFVSDFDNPGYVGDSAYGDFLPAELEYLIAPGDSGGGVFLDFGGGPLLAGVHSFGSARDGKIDSDYGDISGHIRVSAFNSWIDAILGGAIGQPGGGGKGKKFSSGLNGNAAVPEPATALLLLLGSACTFAMRRSRT